MKKIIVLLFTSASITICNASVFTVNNTPGSAAQYTQLNAAIIAANPGDTIYVSGSAVQYADANVYKSLTLIGPGSFANKQNQYPAYVQIIYIDNNTSNVKIEGFQLFEVRGNGWSNISNVDICFNYFPYSGNFTHPINSGGSMVNCSNFIFHNNIIQQNWPITIGSNAGCFNMVIENNIFHIYAGGQPAVSGFNFPSGVIQHNTFIYPSASNPVFSGVSNATIQNNIFYNCDPTSGTSASNFNNNLTFNSGTAFAPLGGTNIDNVDPLFTAVTISAGFNINYNYSVQSSGPAHNSGSDGTDLGYYGGPGILNLSRRGEVINMPVVRQMTIQNITLPQNGNINVKVRSTLSRIN